METFYSFDFLKLFREGIFVKVKNKQEGNVHICSEKNYSKDMRKRKKTQDSIEYSDVHDLNDTFRTMEKEI